MVPFDLHVLSTPPAFVLSQDQTLNKMVSKQPQGCSNHSIEAVLASNFFAVSRVIDKPRVTAKKSMSFDIELWCFSFVTLFNLQGARPSALGRNVCYLSTPACACQDLFRNFFNSFFGLAPRSPVSRTARLVYQTKPRLSRVFFKNFKLFSCFPVFAVFPPPYCVACGKNHKI